MLKFSVAILCLFFFNCLLVNAEDSNNSTLLREKRNAFLQYSPYYYFPYSYYNWYYAYPTYQFTVSTCGVVAACPSQCPGTCGTWSGLHACKFSTCSAIGNPCNFVNIQRGAYLHPYPYDANKYIQCDSTPGVVYIRNCPAGLVFDARFCVCNYPTQVFYTYASHWLKK